MMVLEKEKKEIMIGSNAAAMENLPPVVMLCNNEDELMRIMKKIAVMTRQTRLLRHDLKKMHGLVHHEHAEVTTIRDALEFVKKANFSHQQYLRHITSKQNAEWEQDNESVTTKASPRSGTFFF
jgi:NAD(P)H-nitrite reductase large subunit